MKNAKSTDSTATQTRRKGKKSKTMTRAQRIERAAEIRRRKAKLGGVELPPEKEKEPRKTPEQKQVVAWEAVQLTVKCADCRYHKEHKGPYDKPCSKLGRDGHSAPCGYYYPDYRCFLKENPEVDADEQATSNDLHDFALMLSGFSPRQLRILSFMVKDAEQLRARGFMFGQTVYVNLTTPIIDSVDAYTPMTVVGYSTIGQGFHLVGKPNDPVYSKATMQLPRERFLTSDEFYKYRAELIQKNQILTPDDCKSRPPSAIEVLTPEPPDLMQMERELRAQLRKEKAAARRALFNREHAGELGEQRKQDRQAERALTRAKTQAERDRQAARERRIQDAAQQAEQEQQRQRAHKARLDARTETVESPIPETTDALTETVESPIPETTDAQAARHARRRARLAALQAKTPARTVRPAQPVDRHARRRQRLAARLEPAQAAPKTPKAAPAPRLTISPERRARARARMAATKRT
jgi:hypothetical protein